MNLPQAKRLWMITDTHLGVRNSSEEWIQIMRKYFFEWFIPLVKKEYNGIKILGVGTLEKKLTVKAHKFSKSAVTLIEQAGGKLISVVQLFCELQRDWKRADTVPQFMNLFIETGGTAGIQFSYDKSE